jgi:hypothetical protein
MKKIESIEIETLGDGEHIAVYPNGDVAEITGENAERLEFYSLKECHCEYCDPQSYPCRLGLRSEGPVPTRCQDGGGEVWSVHPGRILDVSGFKCGVLVVYDEERRPVQVVSQNDENTLLALACEPPDNCYFRFHLFF